MIFVFQILMKFMLYLKKKGTCMISLLFRDAIEYSDRLKDLPPHFFVYVNFLLAYVVAIAYRAINFADWRWKGFDSVVKFTKLVLFLFFAINAIDLIFDKEIKLSLINFAVAMVMYKIWGIREITR